MYHSCNHRSRKVVSLEDSLGITFYKIWSRANRKKNKFTFFPGRTRISMYFMKNQTLEDINSFVYVLKFRHRIQKHRVNTVVNQIASQLAVSSTKKSSLLEYSWKLIYFFSTMTMSIRVFFVGKTNLSKNKSRCFYLFDNIYRTVDVHSWSLEIQYIMILCALRGYVCFLWTYK